MTGGLDTHDRSRWRAYSSTYVYDPSSAVGTWTKVGLLGTARVAPAAAVLPDGRVLVAGGAYKDGPPYEPTTTPGRRASRSRASTSSAPGPGTGGGGRCDDVAPPSIGVALATAELFDPATGRWIPTDPMRFARVGRRRGDPLGRPRARRRTELLRRRMATQMDPRVFDTAEVYDPATGRFSLVGSLPPIDRAAIAAAGVEVPTDSPAWASEGTLVALPDGGAFLVGRIDEWKHQGSVTRTFRFDARSGHWHQVGRASADFNDWTADIGADARARPHGRVRGGPARRTGARGGRSHLRRDRRGDDVARRATLRPRHEHLVTPAVLARGEAGWSLDRRPRRRVDPPHRREPNVGAASAVRFVLSP